MILVQFLQDVYWKIVSLGTNPDDYTIGEGQKIIIDHNWVDGKTKHELVWDDKDKQVILFPEHLKVSILKKEKLDKILEDLMSDSRSLLDTQTMQGIINDIKAATTENDVIIAFNRIENTKKQVIASTYGLEKI